MAENSKIEWCDHTFNPWLGCTKVSDGCKNCYAEALMDKRFGRVVWGPGPKGVRVRTGAHYWKQPLLWNKRAEQEGQRARVFCASLADWAEIKPDQYEMYQWRRDLYELIEATPYLDWLMLTKRMECVKDILPLRWLSDGIPDNMWMGTSVENQEQYNLRSKYLSYFPKTFYSMEPLLGPVEMDAGDLVDWVIVGGESGSHARPMDPEWVRALRDQCLAADIPYFFKQWGKWLPFGQDAEGDDGTWCPPGEIVNVNGHTFQGIGKKLAGRLLDGVEWSQFPEVHHAD